MPPIYHLDPNNMQGSRSSTRKRCSDRVGCQDVLATGVRARKVGGTGAVLVVLLSAILVVASCAAPPQPLALGVAADDVSAIDRFSATTGAPVGIYQWYQGWAGAPDFDVTRAASAGARGALPLLTWEPWAPGAGADQPQYALARIVDGTHDAYIATFARQVRSWGGRLGLRFLHELNAPFYPWGSGVNGNTPGDAIAAWEHVRRIFDAEGAHNVVWVWCVNVHAAGYTDYAPLYPGDETVDWVAVDGYNGGDALAWGGWRSPADVFDQSLTDLRRLSERPLAITEVASAEQGGDKASWIKDLFELALDRGVRVLIWFDYSKEADWRVESSPASAAAMHAEATVPGRLGSPPLPLLS
jgi:Glycosyl hydrolase family 26